MKPRLQTAISLAFQACEWLEANYEKFTMPVLGMHSKKDTVTDPTITEAFFNRISSKKKKLVLWESGRHCDAFHGGETLKDEMLVSYTTVHDWISSFDE